MIAGTGIDIIEVGRIAKAMEKPAFLTKVFTPAERAYLEGRAMSAQSAAGMFAAKEAMSKALGTGFAGIGWQELEVRHDEAGRPLAALHNRAAERLAAIGGERVHISISHSREYAVAQAIAEGRPC